MVVLSILDIQPPHDLPSLVPEIDRYGYHRYWCSEHSSPLASASPSVVMGLAAGLSERMRIGSGGVLLRTSIALRVAQDFFALELFFPGRIDLGIAGALGGLEYLSEYEKDVRVARGEQYDERLARLVRLLRQGSLGDGMPGIGPQPSGCPELWLCGTSRKAARLAASLGMSFAYHHYLADTGSGPDLGVGREYRKHYAPVAGSSTPRFAIAMFGACGSDSAAAEREWRAYFPGDEEPQRPSFVGNAAAGAAQIARLAQAYEADEVFLDCFASSFQSRIDGLGSLADAVGISG